MANRSKIRLLKSTLTLALAGGGLVWSGAVRDVPVGDLGTALSLADDGVAMATEFVANEGQWGPDTLFASTHGTVAAFGRGSIRLAEGPEFRFDGIDGDHSVVGEARTRTRFNFIYGNDPSKWHSSVAGYSSILYQQLYAGIDVRVREGSKVGGLEYDVLVSPGADLAEVRISLADQFGALTIAPDGSLLTSGERGVVRQPAPVSWNVAADGSRRRVESRFELLDDDTFGFSVNGADPSLPLVVDPGIEWSTFLGGSSAEWLGGLEAVPGGGGDLVVGGVTRSPEFPAGAGGPIRAAGTPFIARVAANGTSLVYATYFGGSQVHTVQDIAVDAGGRVLAVGDTNSKDFPITAGAFDATPPGLASSPSDFGDYDGYAIRFDASGGSPLMATYISGDPVSGQELPTSAAYDPAGNPVVAGRVNATNFPTTAGAYDRTLAAGDIDVFVHRYNPSGTQLLYGTFLGGAALDQVFDMAVGGDGIINLTGQTIIPSSGARYPTTSGAFDSTVSGANDFEAFFTRLAPNGGSAADLRYSTYLGGNQYTEAGNGIAVHPTDPTQVTLSGFTRSGDFPTTAGALQRVHFAPVDTSMGWVARFNTPTSGGGSIVWSTLYGAPGNQSADAVVVDSAGAAIIVGGTEANNPPTTERAADRVPADGSGTGEKSDAYVAKIAANGASLIYSSLLGARWAESAEDVALIGGNTVVVAGVTTSPDFPTTAGAFDRVYAADGRTSGNDTPGGLANDIFVTRFSLEPTATADTTGPAAPNISWPTEGTIFNVSATSGVTAAFDWSDVTDPSGIRAYHVQVSPNSGFVNDFQSSQNYWFESWSPTSFDSTTYCCGSSFNFTYSMRVRALDNVGNLGPWSSVRTFRVVSASNTGSTGAGLRSVVMNPEFVFGPTTVTGTVTLHAPAPSGGAVVALASQHPSRVPVPASVTVPAGATTATFTTTTVDGLGPIYPTIVASYGGSSHAHWMQVLQAEPTLVLGSVTASAPNVAAGGSLTGTVAFSGIGFVPGPGGAVVNLATTNPAAMQVPASVTIPQGQSSATFPITTTAGAAAQTVFVVASRSSMQTVAVQILGNAALSGLSASPNPAIGSNGSTGTVSLSSAAPSGGVSVSLSSSDTRWARVPASVTVPAGATSAAFAISTTADPTQGQFALITATAGAVTRTVSLNVNPGGSPPPSLSAPSLVSPSSGARFNRGATVNFDWSDVAGATGYVIEIDDSSSFTAPFTVTRTTTSSSTAVSNLASGRYYWRVRATGPSGAVSANSSSRRVEIR